jgi:hypothetical protein
VEASRSLIAQPQMTQPEPIDVHRPVSRTRRDLVNVEAQIHNSEPLALVSIRTHMSGELPRSHQHQEFCLEASGARSFAIPRQSVTVGGHLRAGEKETPRRSEAQKPLAGFMRILNLRASGCNPRGLKTFARGSLPGVRPGFPARLVLPLCGQTEGSD